MIAYFYSIAILVACAVVDDLCVDEVTETRRDLWSDFVVKGGGTALENEENA